MKKIAIKTIVILGPTSSGKSDIAIKLAKKFNGEIISADSRQIYKDMNLGTGKVEGQWLPIVPVGNAYMRSLQENDAIYISHGIPHHLIDFVDPRDEYNISHFQKDCRKLIEEISDRGKVPIICGGTGFWISAVVDDIKLPEVKPNPELRAELDNKSLEELMDILKNLDPDRANTVDRKNKFRLIRAIEIAKAIGKIPKIKQAITIFSPFSKGGLREFLNQAKNKTLLTSLFKREKTKGIKFFQIGIDHPKEILDERIKSRLEKRFEAGMIDEVKKLKEKYNLSWKKIQSFGLGYYWIPLFLQNKISEKELKERTYLAERNYAKRQRTWFKKDKKIVWENDYQKIENLCKKFLK